MWASPRQNPRWTVPKLVIEVSKQSIADNKEDIDYREVFVRPHVACCMGEGGGEAGTGRPFPGRSSRLASASETGWNFVCDGAFVSTRYKSRVEWNFDFTESLPVLFQGIHDLVK